MPGGFPAEIHIPADTWMISRSQPGEEEGENVLDKAYAQAQRQEAVLSVTVPVTAGQAVPAIAKDVTKGVSQGDAHRGLPVPC